MNDIQLCFFCGAANMPASKACAKCGVEFTYRWTEAEAKPSERQIGGSHYRDLAIQPSEYIYRNQMGWLAGNIVKYATRAGRKGGHDGMRTDIEKIKHYAELWLEWTAQPEGDPK